MNRAASSKISNQRSEDQLEVIRALFRTNYFAPPNDTQPQTPVQILSSAHQRAEQIPPASWSTYGEIQFNNDYFSPLDSSVESVMCNLSTNPRCRTSGRQTSKRFETSESVKEPFDFPPHLPKSKSHEWVLESFQGEAEFQGDVEPSGPPPPLGAQRRPRLPSCSQ